MVPSFYDLNLSVCFDTFTFNGTVNISINVREPTKSIKLNSHQLEIYSVAIGQSNAEFSLDVERQLLLLNFSEDIPAGEHVLSIKYKGILNDELAGFYRTKEVDQNGETKWALVTQFEACDARRALPCWDEPV